jgi:hypothetical protein
MRRTAILVVFTFAALAIGCAGSRYMRVASPPRAIQAPPDRALVVFLRPSSLAPAATFTVVDGRGSFLGQLGARQYFVLAAPPGAHTFVAWAENIDVMQAELAPARVYYVLVAARMGAWSAQLSISALTERRQEWASLLTWLRASTQMIPDLAAGQAGLSPGDVQNRVAAANGTWAGYDEAQRAVRVLSAGDGRGPPPL